MGPGATPGKAQTAGEGLVVALCWLGAGLLLLLLPGAGGDCQQPPRFVFAEPPVPTQPSYSVGTRLKYRCRPGYTMDKDKSPLVTCDTNSTWAAQPDFCIGKSCGPPELTNGNFEFTTNLLFGSTITYTCNYGYRLVGKPTATCVLEGSQVSWDNIPYCTIIPCLQPPKIENGQVTDGEGDFTFGMTATYSCNKGFALIGEATIHCTMDENLEGVWSGPAPECRVVSCKNPEVPNGKRLSGFGTKHTYKNTVTFECQPHHLLSGSSVVTCEADSNWNPPLPTCDPIYCGPAPQFPFAKLLLAVGESSPAGTVLSYQCKPGYAAAGGKSSDVTCLDNTTWSADPDFCTRQHCLAPTIANGDVDAKEFLLESVVVFTCRPGYKLKGSSSAKCVVSGSGVDWDTAPPSCERQLCGEPPTIDNGLHNGTKATAFVHGSVVVYKCKDGFTLAGAAFLQCLAGERDQGVWSRPAPECRGGANIIIVGLFPLLLAMLIMNI
ncbi:complement receptor type 1-like [Indicator indicator]|uniref:complement receptor type 1-like n=1 Tax=Indicator indicator TaxID=1002788 RepID=UPI0023DEDF9A|nr:complement receptor type 1-like [Indicator indicator]